MFLDLHSHSTSSDDSRASVEQFVKWASVIRRKGFQIDGFVLTEHRKFDFDKDYSQLARDNDLLILKGSELDTNCGHFLVYGVTEELAGRIDFGNVSMDAPTLVHTALECGAIAVPAHPGRFGIGLVEFIDNGADFSGISVAEHLNGSNRPGEQERAEELIARMGYKTIGGSDAHSVSAIGTCMTAFDNPIASAEDLVRELLGSSYRPIRLEETAAP